MDHTNYVRLHHYSESYELAEYFKEKGVRALFTTDKPIVSHRMPDRNRLDLIEKGYTNYNQLSFVRTDFRVENFANESLEFYDIQSIFDKTVKRYSSIIIYAHEYEFKRTEVYDMLKICIEILDNSLNLMNVSP